MPTRADKNKDAAKTARAQTDKVAQDKKKKRSLRGGGIEGSGALTISDDVQKKAVVDPKKATSDQLPQIRSVKEVASENTARAEEAKSFGEWMSTTLPCVDEYKAADAGTQAEMRDEIALARDYLTGILFHHDRLVRREAWLALFRYRFGQRFISHEDCTAMFSGMVSQELLEEVKNQDVADLPGGENDYGQPMTIYGKLYNFPTVVPFAEKDIVEMQTLVKDLRIRTMNAVKEDREIRMVEIVKQATITMEECRDCKSGLVVFDVPTTEGEDKDAAGAKRVLQGGRLLMESDGKKLFLRDVVNDPGYGSIGVFERKVREMMNMRAQPHLLITPTFAGKKPHFRQDPKTKKYPLPTEMVKNVFLLACLVIRAIDAYFHPDPLKQELLQAAEETVDDDSETVVSVEQSQS